MAQTADYFKRLNLDLELPEARVSDYLKELRGFLDCLEAISFNNEDCKKLYLYRVPEFTAEGCSRLDGALQPEPYDLRLVFGIGAEEELCANPKSLQLYALSCLVEKVFEDTDIDWLGFYQRRHLGSGQEALVKVVYRGVASRAEFPLTREFARSSNNSRVGLTGEVVVINDIERYLWEEGGSYYQCDSRVHSEACLPVLSSDGKQVIGIIDAEAHDRNRFGADELCKLIAAAMVLEDLLASL